MTTSTAPAPTTAHRFRAVLLGGVVVVGLLVVAALGANVLLAQARAASSQPRLTVDAAVPLVALAVVIAALTWLAVLVCVGSRDLLRRDGGPAPAAGPGRCGPLATRIAAVLLAATAFGSVTGSSHAALGAPAPVRSQSIGAPELRLGVGLPVPDFAEATEATTRASGTECTPPAPGWSATGPRLQRTRNTDQVGLLGTCETERSAEVVVHRGDSLWSIVARDLGPDATATDIAEAWPTWYAVNREAIGADPDVLMPGATLHRPTQEMLR